MSYDFLISRNRGDERYAVWRVRPDAKELLERVELSPEARFDPAYRVAPVGGYLLCWKPLELEAGWLSYPYQLLRFDPESVDPLGGEAVQRGVWSKKKFWGYRARYSPNPKEGEDLELIPLSSFVMSLIPAPGRGTFELWNFDPKPTRPGDADPLPAPYTPQEAFPSIQAGHELLPMGNYVLDRLPAAAGPDQFRVWSFDPQGDVPLAKPLVWQGRLGDIGERDRLLPIGELLLAWRAEDRRYRLWRFDATREEPLGDLVASGELPEGFGEETMLTAVQPTMPQAVEHVEGRDGPGSLGFMREKIEHVVYYMLESRSTDNVLGWLYDKGEKGVRFIGGDAPYDGASTEMRNRRSDGTEVFLSKYRDGKLSSDYELAALHQDPFHGNSDNLVQMFGTGGPGYPERATPTMSGFVENFAGDEVMLTFSPEQLPVLNGLAKGFASSDAWFSSIPGGTDINRAFSLTGSAFDKLDTWEGGERYALWPKTPRRQSLFKVLWSNGITDWKIYNAVLWKDFVFTYHLYLEGQVPTIDADPAPFLASVEQFKKDARAGQLPAFSYLEPAWIAPTGTTSYHPGGDLVVGEVALNEIYDALRQGPAWDKTLLVVTFDKGGGIFDHVAPPYATKPWPNDENDGFAFDLMGSRVPALFVSPWIGEKTVVRSGGDVPFDATSFPATLLSWYGIPKARWGLGDRVAAAPTFEAVFTEHAPRKDAPVLTPPYDKRYPPK